MTLTTRIQELARRGDAEAAATVTATAGSSASGSSGSSGRGVATTRATGRRHRRARAGASDACDDDDDVKLAALNAVLQMDSERAMPLLTGCWPAATRAPSARGGKAVFLGGAEGGCRGRGRADRRGAERP
ncbi:MAG: hypothetical protein IPG75_14700 [Gemmatimonadetes bacterium]|nr:hypothetical protein [Gemmatimonadota bacterium]